jgi:capsid protein
MTFLQSKKPPYPCGVGANLSANADLRRDLRNLRALSRHLANNEYAKRFLGLLKNNVVGPTGIRLQAMPLDDDGKVDRADAKYIETAWKDFCRAGIPTVDGRLSMIDACKLFIETLASGSKKGRPFFQIGHENRQ